MSGVSDIGPYSITPRWVALACKGKPFALALYVALADHADRSTDNGWTISREALADEIGCSVETVDRMARILVDAGAVVIMRRRQRGTNRWAWSRYLVKTSKPVVTDDEWMGEPVVTGDDVPCVTGDDGIQEPLFDLLTPCAQPAVERDRFLDFWELFPRRVAKADARKAWDEAVKVAGRPSPGMAEVILIALKARCAWWLKDRTPKDKIPYPATWLNRQQWLDEIEPVPKSKAASGAQAQADHEARQRDEVEAAIADGNDELAWKILLDKAKAKGGMGMFVKIATDLTRGRSDATIRAGHDVTQEQIDEVRNERERLRRAASEYVSPLARPSPQPALEAR